MDKKFFSTKDIILIAMFAALTSVLSQFIIPLPFSPVPINLATISIFLVGGLLTPIKAAFSQVIFVLLGLIGLPVFAGFGSGLGILFGPTGGYIIGYIFASLTIAILIKYVPKNILSYGVVMAIGLFVCYILGTLWFMFLTKNALVIALSLCVTPFLFGDFIKIVIASILVLKLEKHI